MVNLPIDGLSREEKKSRGNQKKGLYKSEFDTIEGTDSDSSYVSNI